ncbi:MAG: hypothetical protein RLZZ37_267 [Actinomycetota bacterium]
MKIKNTFRFQIIFIALITLLLLIPVPFIRIAPGPLFNTIGTERDKDVITIIGTKTYESKGEINFTTVSETGGPFGRLVLINAISSWIDPTEAVVPASDLYPENEDPEIVKKRNEKAFSNSQSDAIAAALTYLKIPVPIKVVVDSVVVNSPSDGKIEPGDVVVSVNGKKVQTASDVVKFVQENKPKDLIKVKVIRQTTEKEVEIIAQELKTDKSKASIGISIGPGIDPPYKFNFGISEVGGPSAGLMLSLGIVDELTPDDLTKGFNISGTGTINYLGQVGPIGGIRQKLEGAASGGSQLFLAPKENCDEVLSKNYKNMPVVAVTDLKGAIEAINRFTKQSNAQGLPNCELVK